VGYWEWLIETFMQTVCISYFEEFKMNPLKYIVIILLLGFVGFILATYGVYLREVC